MVRLFIAQIERSDNDDRGDARIAAVIQDSQASRLGLPHLHVSPGPTYLPRATASARAIIASRTADSA